MPGVVTAGRLVDDRYLLVEALDEGGMGIQWRAEDLISERLVTVKELRFPDPLDHMQRRALAARVRREARAMAEVDHPGLARIVAVVDDSDRPWVVTELLDAPTLDWIVRHDGPLEPERAALAGIRILDVLTAAHAQAMVHRFLQPSKVFIGGTGEVRVADFGIASLIGDPTVARSGAVGGVSYMAPEQAGSSEADIWSLGAVLYFAVEGVPPFAGADSAAILEAINGTPPRPATKAGSLARVLEVTLQKDASERPSADELRVLLEVAAGALAPPPEPEVGPGAAVADAGAEVDVAADAGAEVDVAADAGAEVDAVAAAGAEVDAAADADAGIKPDGETGGTVDVVIPEPEEEWPPPSLPPRIALARMFSPAPGSAPTTFTLEEEHREPAPPWPVPRGRSPWTIAVCAAVTLVLIAILFTNGREILTRNGQSARVIASVDWSRYTDPATGFQIDYPADWIVSREGQYTDFRHPAAAAALRIVVQDSNNRSPEAAWIALESRFRIEQQSYSRIRLESTKFRDLSAAEWEFTYVRGDVPLHNLDLGVVTGGTAFTLNFESRQANWSVVKAFMERFESSFQPPTA